MTLLKKESLYNYLFRFFSYSVFNEHTVLHYVQACQSFAYAKSCFSERITRTTEVPVLISRGLLLSFLFQLSVPFARLSASF